MIQNIMKIFSRVRSNMDISLQIKRVATLRKPDDRPRYPSLYFRFESYHTKFRKLEMEKTKKNKKTKIQIKKENRERQKLS